MSVLTTSLAREIEIFLSVKNKLLKQKKTIKKNNKHRLEENSKIYMGIKKVLSLLDEKSCKLSPESIQI